MRGISALKTILWATALLLVCFAAVLLAMSIKQARAHDHHRPQLNDWMKSLVNNGGVPCCDGSDATRLDNVDWQSVCEAGTGECHYQVRIEGAWWNVPPNAVLKNPNLSGVALVWPVMYGTIGQGDRDIVIRCFLPGVGT